MPSMVIAISGVPSFAMVGVGYQFTGTVNLPTVVNGAIRINSMRLYYGYGRTYNVAPYLTAVCGDTTFRMDYFTISETGQSSLKERDMNVLTWNVGTDHLLRQNGRTITFTAQKENSTTSKLIDRPRGGDMTLTVDYTILQSSLSLSSTNVAAGSAITARISAGDAAYSHKLVWQFGSRAQTVSVAAGVTASPLTVPLEWLDQIPDAVTGLGSCRLETHSGSTLVGAETAYFNVSVPASVIPTIESLTATRVDNSVPEDWGLYIQGQSGVTIEATGAGAYGSSITAWRIAGDGRSADEPTLSLASLLGSGTLVFTAMVTDSRGRTAKQQLAIEVTPYSGPVIREFNAVRATEAGEADPTGAYLLVQVAAGVSDCRGKNQGFVTLQYRERNTMDWREAVTGVYADSGPWLVGGGIDITKAWDVQVILTDAFMAVTAQDLVTTAECYIDRMPGRRRLGIGGYCETDNAVYVAPDMKLLHGDDDIKELIQTAQETAENALAGGSNPLDAYPVGALYWSSDPTSPASLFGGTWTQIKDRFVLAAGSSYSNGAAGGNPWHAHSYGFDALEYYYENVLTLPGVSGLHTYDSANKLTIAGNWSHSSGYYQINKSSESGASQKTIEVKRTTATTSYVNTLPPYIVKYCWERTA